MDAREAIELYRQRWSIETPFGYPKSMGINWAHSHEQAREYREVHGSASGGVSYLIDLVQKVQEAGSSVPRVFFRQGLESLNRMFKTPRFFVAQITIFSTSYAGHLC